MEMNTEIIVVSAGISGPYFDQLRGWKLVPKKCFPQGQRVTRSGVL